MLLQQNSSKRWLRIGVFAGLLLLTVFIIFNQTKKLDTQSDAKLPSTTTDESFNEASSLTVVVNKARALPSSYKPLKLVIADIPSLAGVTDSNMLLRKEAAEALAKLDKVAAKDGIYFKLLSGYRSYHSQSVVYKRLVGVLGPAQADRESARPGHSEHQTGLAADLGAIDDICALDQCFGNTTQGQWLANNSHKYGFILRYPKNQEEFTGYSYEPWHLRFVGTKLAAEIYQKQQTLEQFFNLPAATDYSVQKYILR